MYLLGFYYTIFPFPLGCDYDLVLRESGYLEFVIDLSLPALVSFPSFLRASNSFHIFLNGFLLHPVSSRKLFLIIYFQLDILQYLKCDSTSVEELALLNVET